MQRHFRPYKLPQSPTPSPTKGYAACSRPPWLFLEILEGFWITAASSVTASEVLLQPRYLIRWERLMFMKRREKMSSNFIRWGGNPC